MLITWTYASICKFYSLILPDVPHYFNGEELPKDKDEYIEINIYGPMIERADGKDALVNCIIDVIPYVAKRNKNIYREMTICDTFEKNITDIPVYKKGDPDDPKNDNSFVYCLSQLGPSAFTKIGSVENGVEFSRSVLRTGFSQVVAKELTE